MTGHWRTGLHEYERQSAFSKRSTSSAHRERNANELLRTLNEIWPSKSLTRRGGWFSSPQVWSSIVRRSCACSAAVGGGSMRVHVRYISRLSGRKSMSVPSGPGCQSNDLAVAGSAGGMPTRSASSSGILWARGSFKISSVVWAVAICMAVEWVPIPPSQITSSLPLPKRFAASTVALSAGRNAENSRSSIPSAAGALNSRSARTKHPAELRAPVVTSTIQQEPSPSTSRVSTTRPI
mmetsp:Transcript_36102/g.90159  ORF Transcript_36102/g.90159 Transcript_36102/m.90159 type:complete len:237 (+) Transcript_36102:195-905(+)